MLIGNNLMSYLELNRKVLVLEPKNVDSIFFESR